MKSIINNAAKLVKGILPKKEYVTLSGSILPPKHGRLCGREFRNHKFYLKSAEAEAKRLVTHFNCDRNSKVLDVGSGQGRLPIGILRVIGELDYLGIDVEPASVDWCNRYIGQAHPSFRFLRMNVYSERSNKTGVRLDENFRFDVPSESIDIVYLFSVFSHMTEEDMKVYLKDFRRVLKKTGILFFTTFVEKDVPNISFNPDGYVFKKSRGPLHVVRYNEGHLFSILDQLGYQLDKFTHATEADSQSALYLSKRA